MSEQRHAPGPWEVDYADDGHLEVCDIASVIAVVSHYEGHEEANARLISAAPFLLLALKDLLDKRTAHNEVVAGAAIAKAEGR